MKLSVSIPAARQGRESHLGLTYDEDSDRVEIFVPSVPRMASATTSVDAEELDKAMTALRRSKPPKPIYRGSRGEG